MSAAGLVIRSLYVEESYSNEQYRYIDFFIVSVFSCVRPICQSAIFDW